MAHRDFRLYRIMGGQLVWFDLRLHQTMTLRQALPIIHRQTTRMAREWGLVDG